MLGPKRSRCVRILICGIEALHMIRKGQLGDIKDQASCAAKPFYSPALGSPPASQPCLGLSLYGDRTDFGKVKAGLEKPTGKRTTERSLNENTRDCGYSFTERKNLTLTEVPKGKNAKTLFGCYYYYEK